jgi:hypothetical protein
MPNIYVARGTERSGPFTEAEVRAQLASGTVTGASLVWWEGQKEWLPLSQTGLAAPALGGPPPAPPPAPPAGALPPGQKKTSTLAIVSLVLGCLGWMFPVAFGPAGVITGHLGRAEIRRDPSLGGKGMALAGLILGYFWSSFILLAFVSIVAISVLIALGNQVKTVFSTISSQEQVAPAGGSGD